MIFYYWGKDNEGSRRAARAEFLIQREKFPNAPVFDLVGENLTLEELQEAIYARPLLGGGGIIFFDHLLTNSITANFLSESLLLLVGSENIFIFWEDAEGKEFAQAVVKVGGIAREFKVMSDDKEQQKKADLMKLFAVADALGNRDRKQAWLLYHDARRDGLSAEEIFWKLAWKVKTLLLVETAPAGSALPMKPYPLSQARRQVKGYKPGELAHLSGRLVRFYHDARRGLTDFDLGLEKLLLEL
ncbi:MAG: hypothetical protein V1704_02375 [Candidatus Vogelbacteria bacterium]